MAVCGPGTDAARGEYVMIVDHGDRLGDEAPERPCPDQPAEEELRS
ncbi:hypothetical protein ACIQU5_04960 [Streptomyces sp. NPDC090306]